MKSLPLSSQENMALFIHSIYGGLNGYAGILARWPKTDKSPMVVDGKRKYVWSIWLPVNDLLDQIRYTGQKSLYDRIETLNKFGYNLEIMTPTIRWKLNEPREKAQFGKKSDLLMTRSLGADIDNVADLQEGVEKALKFRPTPSLIIRSGGGLHLYWLLENQYCLETQESIDNIEAYRRGIASFLQSDKALVDCSHKTRLPGTLNPKYNPPKSCYIVYFNRQVYNLSDFSLYREFKPTHDFSNLPPAERIEIDDKQAQAIIDKAIDELSHAPNGDRNNVLNAKALRLGRLVAANKIDRAKAEGLLYDAALRCGLVEDTSKAAVERSIESGLTSGIEKGVVLKLNGQQKEFSSRERTQWLYK